MAHGVHKSLQIHRTRESRFFVVQNNVADASRASDGMIVLSKGVMAGHTILTNPTGAAWHQPHFLSVVPSNSVESHIEHTRAKALHIEDSPEFKHTFAARVAWHSDIGDKIAHTDAQKTYYSMSDPFTQRWMQQLGPYSSALVDQKDYSMVTAQLPNISTLYADESDLAELARASSTPLNIPVALDNPIVARIPYLYDSVISVSAYGQRTGITLDAIFRNVFEVEKPRGSFGRLYNNSALDAEEDDALFGDDNSEDTRIVPAGANTNPTRMEIPDSILNKSEPDYARPPVSYIVQNRLIMQNTGLNANKAPKQFNAINLSKELLRVITLDP
jgi:hypothetical protein